MADTALAALTAASALTGTELFYADDGAADVKVTATQIKTFAKTVGSDTQVIFSDAGVMAGDAGLTYNKTTDALTVAGQITSSKAYSVSAPNFINALSLTTGFSITSNGIYFSQAGVSRMVLGSAGLLISSTLSLSFGASDADSTSGDTFLFRDAANTLAYRNGTAAQTQNHYDTWVSATDYHRLAIKTARATLSNVSGASVTATALIPDGAILVGLTSKVTTGLGVTGGTTGYTIGDGSDVDRWGAIVGTAAGTSSDNTSWTAGTIQAFTAAQDVVVTASGGNFDATGVIYLSAQYLIGQCD